MYKKLKKRFSRLALQKKLTLFIICLFSITTLVSFLVIFRIISGDYRQQVEKQVDLSVHKISQQIQRLTDAMTGAAQVVAFNEDVRAILTEHSNAKETIDLSQEYRNYLKLKNILFAAEKGIIPLLDKTENGIHLTLYFYTNEFYSVNNDTFRNIEEYFQFLREQARPEIEFCLADSNDKKQIVFFSKILSSLDFSAGVGAISVGIPRENMTEILRGVSGTENGLAFLMDEEEKILSETSRQGEEQSGLDVLASESTEEWRTVSAKKGNYRIKRYSLGKTGWQLALLIPLWEINAPARHAGIAMGIVMLVVLAIAVFLSSGFANLFTKRLRFLVKSMIRVRQGDWNVKIGHYEEDEVGALYESFDFMLEELRRFSRKQYEDLTLLKAAELHTLQAQINPHFLYNTLDLIVWEAKKNNDTDVEEITKTLARFYRLGLKNGHDIVDLRDEIEHIRAYIYIQNRRFSGIQLTVDIAEDMMERKLPRLTLQPIVENAILHGLQPLAEKSEKQLTISASSTSQFWNIMISDNGNGIPTEKIKHLLDKPSIENEHGYGLRNVEDRLKLFFGPQAGLIFDSTPHLGTTVIIHLPLREGA